MSFFFAHNLCYLWTVFHMGSVHTNEKRSVTSSTTYARRSYKDSKYAFALSLLYLSDHTRPFTDILQCHYIIFAGQKSIFLKPWSTNLWRLCPQHLKGTFHFSKIKHHMLMKYYRLFNMWTFLCTVMDMAVRGAPQKPTLQQLTQRTGTMRGQMFN